MKWLKPAHWAVIAFVVFLSMAALSGFYEVQEGQSAIVLRLGQITGGESKAVRGPGLHYRVPFIDSVRWFDRRLQQLANSASGALTVVTSEQTYLVVDYFARWEIRDPVRFYTSTGGSIPWAESLLEQRLNDVVRAEYGRRTSDEAISTGRSSMTAMFREQADVIGKDLGIRVSDVRIDEITLPKDVINSVFDRMASERRQFAAARRAEGMEKAEVIRAEADQQVVVIKARAESEGAALRAKGEEASARIYATAYGSNQDFYAFWRSLEAYRKSFTGQGDILVLQPDGKFFNQFHGGQTQGGSKS